MRQTIPRPLSYCSTAGRVSRSIARRLLSDQVITGHTAFDPHPPEHSRLCRSTIDMILIGHSAVVTWNWKVTAQIRSGASVITVGGAVEIRGLCTAGAVTPKPSAAPKTLRLMVIDPPAFCMCVVIWGPNPPSRMLLGVVAQPVATSRPDRAGGSDRLGALGGWRRTCGDARSEDLQNDHGW
jgi:hypothetical protein